MKVIFVTGTPGVGKTVTARRLARKLGTRVIELNTLAKRHKLIRGFDRARKSSIVDLPRLSRVVEEALGRSRGDVIFEGHYVPRLPKARVRCVFVLRCYPMELMRRLKLKGFDRSKVVENVWAEVLDYCLTESVRLYGKAKVYEIDTTSKTVGETVEKILQVLDGKIEAPPGRFDWLSKLKFNGELERLMEAEGV